MFCNISLQCYWLIVYLSIMCLVLCAWICRATLCQWRGWWFLEMFRQYFVSMFCYALFEKMLIKYKEKGHLKKVCQHRTIQLLKENVPFIASCLIVNGLRYLILGCKTNIVQPSMVWYHVRTMHGHMISVHWRNTYPKTFKAC